MGSSIEGPSSGDGYGRSKVQVERSLDGAFAFGGFWNHRAHPREGGAEAGGIFMKARRSSCSRCPGLTLMCIDSDSQQGASALVGGEWSCETRAVEM